MSLKHGLMAFVVVTLLSGCSLAAGSFGGLVVPNMGQVKAGEAVRYYMDAPWGQVYVTNDGLILEVQRMEKVDKEACEEPDLARLDKRMEKFKKHESRIVHRTSVHVTIPGACWTELIPEDPQITKLNFFFGTDPKRWVTDVSAYGRLRIKNIYAGTDLIIDPKTMDYWRMDGVQTWRMSDLQARLEIEAQKAGLPGINTIFAEKTLLSKTAFKNVG